ncbi:hypothetical protein Pcinc_006716 [Petrolisthes cinctipes]|nr:hypothetical protein Pcinc_006716 [Petrolisthes cinctipes]
MSVKMKEYHRKKEKEEENVEARASSPRRPRHYPLPPPLYHLLPLVLSALLVSGLRLPVFQSHTYNRYQERIQIIAQRKYNKVNESVVKAVFEYYSKELDVAPDNDGILNIEVVFDATWMTRGHSSLIGVGAVIEAHTGFVLDGHAFSKYCNAFIYWDRKVKENKKLIAKYKNWKASHECQESSGKMEAAAATALWSRSLNKKLKYTVFVGDGDSSAYKAVCDLNNREGPYGKDCTVVKEYVNHVSKRVGKRLRTLKKKLTVPVQTKKGKTVMRSKIGGIGELSDRVIDKMAHYYGNTIRRHVGTGTTVEELKKTIFATFYHLTSTDTDPQHQDCPQGKGSWCFYNDAISNNKTPQSHNKMKVHLHNIAKDDLKHIEAIYKDLTEPNLLSRCMKGRTQNVNESFHSKMWKKSVKTKFHGLGTVKYAFHTAALEHNVGYESGSLFPEVIGGLPTVSGLADQEVARERASTKVSAVKTKRRKTEGGASTSGYAPGAF